VNFIPELIQTFILWAIYTGKLGLDFLCSCLQKTIYTSLQLILLK